MKRIISLILAAVMTVSLLTVPVFFTATADGESDYAYFEGFEGKMSPKTGLPGHWENGGDSVLNAQVVETKSSEGSHSLRMNDGSGTTSNGAWTSQIKLDPNKYYKACADVFCETGSCELYVEYYNSSLYKLDFDHGTSASLAKWETIEVPFKVADGTYYTKLLLNQSSVNFGVTYFDNIRIVEISAEEYEEAGKVDFTLFECKNNSHPRLYYTADTVSTLKDRANNSDIPYGFLSGKDMAKEIIAQADDYLTETSLTYTFVNDYTVVFPLPFTDLNENMAIRDEPPGYSGDYPYWTYLSRQLEVRIQYLTLASIITDDEAKADEYAKKAIEYGDDLCTWDTWSDKYYENGTTCLDTAHLTMSAVTVYDMLYDRLSDDQKTNYRRAIYQKALKPLAEATDGSHDSTNVQVMKAAALMSADCVLLGEIGAEDGNNFLNIAKNYFTWYLDYLATSGDHEGFLYSTYCIEYMMVALDHLKSVTGDDTLFQHPYLSDFLMKWAVYAGENTFGQKTNISDATDVCTYDVTASLLFRENKNLLAGYYIKRTGCCATMTGFNEFIYHQDEIEVDEPTDVCSTLLPEVGWGCLRTGWGTDDSILVFTSSLSNQWHNHWDNNSFMLSIGGSWLAQDPGYANYQTDEAAEYTSKSGHTGILIDDQQWQVVKGTGVAVQKIASEYFSLMTGKDPASYHNSVGMTKSDRNFILVNHKEDPYYLVIDDIEATKDHKYTWRMNISEINDVYFDSNKAELKTEAAAKNAFLVGYAASLGVSFAEDGLNMSYHRFNDSRGKILDVTDNIASGTKNYIAALTPIINDNIHIDLSTCFEDVNVSDNDLGLIGQVTTADGRNALTFSPYSKESSFNIRFFVENEGDYDISMNLLKGAGYGKWNITLDGEELLSYDGVADGDPVCETAAGKSMHLDSGKHIVKFTNGGETENAMIGMISFDAVNSDKIDDLAKMTRMATVSEDLTDENVIGCRVSYGKDSKKEDIVLLSRYTTDELGVDIYGGINAAGIVTDGSSASVCDVSGDKISSGFTVTEATSLTYNGKTLLTSSTPVSAAISYEGQKSVITAPSDATVTFRLPDDDLGLKTLKVGGKKLKLSDANDGMITVNVTAGDNAVELIYDSSIPAWVWILVAAAAAAVAAAIAFVIINKKKGNI